jgi:hypothetical protein
VESEGRDGRAGGAAPALQSASLRRGEERGHDAVAARDREARLQGVRELVGDEDVLVAVEDVDRSIRPLLDQAVHELAHRRDRALAGVRRGGQGEAVEVGGRVGV